MNLAFPEIVLTVGLLLIVVGGLSGLAHGTVLSVSVLAVAAGMVLNLLGVIEFGASDPTIVAVIELALVFTLFGDGLVVERELPADQLEEMMETTPGAGSPAGPGTNNAGLGIFKWAVPCGEIWGHTGSFPGYRTLGAATEDGSGAIGMTVNATGLPEEAEQAVLRVQELATCRALGEPVG